MLRYKITVLFVFAIFLNTFSQSKKLWMSTADNAFKAKDYATAAFYYAKVLDDTTVLDIYVLPYEAQMVNLKLKALIKVPEWHLRSSHAKKDSIQKISNPTDSIAKFKNDSIKKAQPQKFNYISKIDYVYYQLGQSYRLNADYDNAVKTFKTVVERNVYSDAKFYYAICLMNIKYYKAALNEFDQYVNSNPPQDTLLKIAQKKEASCYFALDSMNSRREILVHLMDTNIFNKGTSNFAPMYYLSPNKIIFTIVV